MDKGIYRSIRMFIFNKILFNKFKINKHMDCYCNNKKHNEISPYTCKNCKYKSTCNVKYNDR